MTCHHHGATLALGIAIGAITAPWLYQAAHHAGTAVAEWLTDRIEIGVL